MTDLWPGSRSFFIKYAQQIDQMAGGFPEPPRFEVEWLPQDETKPQKVRKGRKDKGKKRGKSAYNLFVSDKIKVLKAQKLEKYEKEPKLVFKDAIAMWAAAGKQEKEAYTQKLLATSGGEQGTKRAPEIDLGALQAQQKDPSESSESSGSGSSAGSA